MQLDKGRIVKTLVYSDAMDEEFIGMIPKELENCTFNSKSIAAKIRCLNVGEIRKQMVEDITNWLEETGY